MKRKIGLSLLISLETELLKRDKGRAGFLPLRGEDLCYAEVQSPCLVYMHKPYPTLWQCRKSIALLLVQRNMLLISHFIASTG